MTAGHLSISGLHFHYPDGTPALAGVDLEIAPGESVALVGANGAGKSTLMMALTGCLEHFSGSIRIDEVAVESRTLREVRRRVGLAMQDPDDQLFMPTVGEDVAFGPRNQGLSEAEVEARVAAALGAVGAAALRGRPPYRLSGGEKRAAALAAVLAMQPDVLALDEPSAALDPRARRQSIAWLMSFPHTRLIATHDLDLALEVCARTVVLARGRVAADGPSREILADRVLLESCGLELPLGLQGCSICSHARGAEHPSQGQASA